MGGDPLYISPSGIVGQTKGGNTLCIVTAWPVNYMANANYTQLNSLFQTGTGINLSEFTNSLYYHTVWS
jgi:hypothetical protein